MASGATQSYPDGNYHVISVHSANLLTGAGDGATRSALSFDSAQTQVGRLVNTSNDATLALASGKLVDVTANDMTDEAPIGVYDATGGIDVPPFSSSGLSESFPAL